MLEVEIETLETEEKLKRFKNINELNQELFIFPIPALY